MNSLNFTNIIPKILGTSQKGQDSIIEYIFDSIGTTNKYYVEFGAVDGVLFSNTHYLRNNKGWTGLLLDGGYQDPNINLHRAFITQENICNLFYKFNVPCTFDFLCIDIDGNDYWVLLKILNEFSPRVIQIESNVRFEPYESVVQRYDPNWIWDGRKWYGASPFAIKKLANQHNYTVVHSYIDDLFLIKNNLLSEMDIDKDWSLIYPNSNVSLYDSHLGYNPELGLANREETDWVYT